MNTNQKIVLKTAMAAAPFLLVVKKQNADIISVMVLWCWTPSLNWTKPVFDSLKKIMPDIYQLV